MSADPAQSADPAPAPDALGVPADELPGAAPARAPATPAPASKRRAVAGAIALIYLVRLLVAALASYPFIARVRASGLLHGEAGDGALFAPGGLYLLELLVHERAGLAALVAPTAALLLGASLAGLVPEWLLLRALGRGASAEAPPPREVAPGRALPRLLLLALASWVARALLVVASLALAGTASASFAGARDERTPLIGAAGAALVGLAGWVSLALLRDLCAIEITRGAAPLDAVERAFGVLRGQALGLAARYAGQALAGLLALLAGAAAASAFDVSTGRAGAALAAGALHQLGLVAQIALRAAWLASASAAARRRPEGRREPGRAQADAFL